MTDTVLHDPMCGTAMIRDDRGQYVLGCGCELIAVVRADERERAAERVAALPANPALHYGSPRLDKSAAVAAARGGAA